MPVSNTLHRYNKVQQEIIDYHIHNMLTYGIIMPVASNFVWQFAICHKNSGDNANDPEAISA